MASAAQARPAPGSGASTAWSTLIAAGLADGAARRLDDGRFDDTGIRAAFEQLPPVGALDQTSRELLLAWLCALRDHFRERFAAVLGLAGEEWIERLYETPIDLDRVLKLRRISLERLAVLV